MIVNWGKNNACNWDKRNVVIGIDNDCGNWGRMLG